MSKFFGYVNEIDSHKNIDIHIQPWKIYGLLSVNWLWFCTTVGIRRTLTNFRKIFCKGFQIEKKEKSIGIIEFLEWIDLYCFKNTLQLNLGLQLQLHFASISNTRQGAIWCYFSGFWIWDQFWASCKKRFKKEILFLEKDENKNPLLYRHGD